MEAIRKMLERLLLSGYVRTREPVVTILAVIGVSAAFAVSAVVFAVQKQATTNPGLFALSSFLTLWGLLFVSYGPSQALFQKHERDRLQFELQKLEYRSDTESESSKKEINLRLKRIDNDQIIAMLAAPLGCLLSTTGIMISTLLL